MAGKYDDLARFIIQNVGGGSNVIKLSHCMTRLRFKLIDVNKANTEELKKTDGVVTAFISGGQYQVVIGNHVTDVFRVVNEIGGIGSEVISHDGSIDNKYPQVFAPKAKSEVSMINSKVNIENLVITSPLKGKVIKLSDLTDLAFATEVLGKGVAILPEDGKLLSPIDGEVTAFFPTGHAIGLKADFGAELLIHIGMETVKLEGKYFHKKVNQGDIVKKGQVLLEFDLNAIITEGYLLESPVIITNPEDFHDIAYETGQVVTYNDTLITLL